MMMQGHKNSVLELHWTADGDNILTCSPDKTLRLWDATTGERTGGDHIAVAVARHPEWIPPVSGSYHGQPRSNMDQALSLSVVASAVVSTA